mmetsp:Transcript_11486/g.9909  ORF Transcript_11486/g.9909 Transcript_11486/m.9909 type:complete len:209 (-) Transcript_11486:928-1554(-)
MPLNMVIPIKWLKLRAFSLKRMLDSSPKSGINLMVILVKSLKRSLLKRRRREKNCKMVPKLFADTLHAGKSILMIAAKEMAAFIIQEDMNLVPCMLCGQRDGAVVEDSGMLKVASKENMILCHSPHTRSSVSTTVMSTQREKPLILLVANPIKTRMMSVFIIKASTMEPLLRMGNGHAVVSMVKELRVVFLLPINLLNGLKKRQNCTL